MRFTNPILFLLVAAMASVLACDFPPGTSYRSRQTLNTWDVIDDDCLTVGSYIYGVDTTINPYKDTSSIRIRPEDNDDREVLPLRFTVNYRLNGNIYYQQSFPLKNGTGRLNQEQPSVWNLDEGDRIDVEACALDGYVPVHSRIDLRLRFEFRKMMQYQVN